MLDPLKWNDKNDTTRPAWIILISTGLIVLWFYFGTSQFYDGLVASGDLPEAVQSWDHKAVRAYYHFASALVLLGLIPAAIIKFGFRESLKKYGCNWGEKEKAKNVRNHLLLTFPLFFGVGLFAAYAFPEDLGAYYPRNRSAMESHSSFILHLATYFLYYVAWEFHFRGFLLQSLTPRMGAAGAIAVQTLASTLVHLGGAPCETIGAFFAGLLWGFVACRTGSIVPSLAMHFAIGIGLDIGLCYL